MNNHPRDLRLVDDYGLRKQTERIRVYWSRGIPAIP